MRLTNIIFCIVVLCLLSASVCAADTSEQVEESGPFAGSFADAIWTVVAFVILLLILWWKAWSPMLAGLQTRQKYIEKQFSDSEKIRKQADEVFAEYQARLDKAEAEGQQIIASHLKDAQLQSANIVANAKEQIETTKAKVENDIQIAQQAAQKELFVKAGDIVMQLGAEILGRSIKNEDNQKMIDQAVQKLKQEENNKS